MKNHSMKALSLLFVLALVLVMVPAAVVIGEPEDLPTVNGRFYGDGDDERYGLLAIHPEGRGAIYAVEDAATNTLYVAVVSDPGHYDSELGDWVGVNDNVFAAVANPNFDGDPGEPNDPQYVQDVGWAGQSNQHTAKALINSEHLEMAWVCGGTVQTWFQDYAYSANGDVDPAEKDWVSDVWGPDGSKVAVTGLISSSSSFAWNMNLTTYDVTTGGTRPTINDWRSPDSNNNSHMSIDGGANFEDGWPEYDSATGWEWSVVYEMQLDISSCPDSYEIWAPSAHHSPPKSGENDVPIPVYDYGDAPYDTINGQYPTEILQNGARHQLVTDGPMLGAIVDGELNGQPDGSAYGDDINLLTWDPTQPLPPDDEDGVNFLNDIQPGEQVFVEVIVTLAAGDPDAVLDAWIDFNSDGDWDDPGEHIFANQTMTPGVHTLDFMVPIDAADDSPLYARFRLSSDGSAYPFGSAADGEVEDYVIDYDPAAVDLTSFTATGQVNAVVLNWETASELDNLGFNLYRAESVDGPRLQINGALIPSAVPGSPVGASYEFVDGSAKAGVTYYYWLADVDLYGQATLNGPVIGTALFPEAPVFRVFLPAISH